MLRLLRWLAVGVLAVAASACATMNVSSHVEPGLDFTQYKSWAWGAADALPTSDPRLDDAFFRDHLQGAVERELARRGLGQPEPSGAPDILVHHHANVTPRIDVNRGDPTTGACYDGDCRVRVLEQEVGTIMIDVLDARTKRLIWRGWAQTSVEGVLGDPEKVGDRVAKAVTAMFKRFPRSL
jgi:hypothetical protein